MARCEALTAAVVASHNTKRFLFSGLFWASGLLGICASLAASKQASKQAADSCVTDVSISVDMLHRSRLMAATWVSNGSAGLRFKVN